MQPASISRNALLSAGNADALVRTEREREKLECAHARCTGGVARVPQQLTRFIKAQTRISLLNHATAFQRAKLFLQIVLAMVLDNYQAVFP
jgi:hypothetical protein